MQSDLHIKDLVFGSVEHRQSIELRRRVLRLPLGIDFTSSELASESDQIHLAAFNKGELLAVLLFKICSVKTACGLKMRQVAVEPSKQGTGIGKALVGFSEQWALDHGYTYIELHARKTAQPFYLSLGYQTVGDDFEEVGIPHVRMEKQLI